MTESPALRRPSALALCLLLLPFGARAAEEPKQTPANTITLELTEPAKPQKFPRSIKFHVADLVDRSGNPQPLLVYKPRGGVFLDRPPIEIVRQTLGDSLKAADLLAADADAADYLLTVYVFHFGLASGSGYEFFAKVELNVVVKNRKTGQSQTVTALGTSIENPALRKKNILKNVKANLEEALQDALRNFLRGNKLREAVETPPPPPGPSPAGTAGF